MCDRIHLGTDSELGPRPRTVCAEVSAARPHSFAIFSPAGCGVGPMLLVSCLLLLVFSGGAPSPWPSVRMSDDGSDYKFPDEDLQHRGAEHLQHRGAEPEHSAGGHQLLQYGDTLNAFPFLRRFFTRHCQRPKTTLARAKNSLRSPRSKWPGPGSTICPRAFSRIKISTRRWWT